MPGFQYFLGVPLCYLWLGPFQNRGKEAVTRMHTGNCPQEIAADQLVHVFPDEFARDPKTHEFVFSWKHFELCV